MICLVGHILGVRPFSKCLDERHILKDDHPTAMSYN